MKWRARNDLVGWGKSWLIWSDELNDCYRQSGTGAADGIAISWPGREEDEVPPPDCRAKLDELNGAEPKAKK